MYRQFLVFIRIKGVTETATRRNGNFFGSYFECY